MERVGAAEVALLAEAAGGGGGSGEQPESARVTDASAAVWTLARGGAGRAAGPLLMLAGRLEAHLLPVFLGRLQNPLAAGQEYGGACVIACHAAAVLLCKALELALVRAVSRWTFAPATNDVTLTYPFIFYSKR